MSRLIFDLTEEDRAALEAHRIRLGLRSHAETLRALIRDDGAVPVMAEPTTPRPSFSHGRSKTVVVPAKRLWVDAPTSPRAWSGGHPKPGKR